MMQSEAIRRTFLDYFARQGHTVLPSSSLIPYGDNTILFTNAGMNQFKNAFLGLEKRPYVRAATAQKVMRVSGKHNDLENVGPSRRHHTFFEMLGNFSFGDYFKEDAMKYALELMEGEYGFERERLWFTIYKDDDQSYDLWQKVGIKANRILRFGEKDNFWSMGPTGPCGPNSEIHYFTGKLQDNDPKWVNNDDDPNETTVEVWNLVFMQFNRTEDGVLHPLPQTGVDTGMGFERLCRLIEGGESNYDTDLFMPIMDKVQQLARQTNAARKEQYVAYRVIADHVRAATFLIGDGVLPGNEGRNYVLRMVMRRAMRYGRDLGFEAPFLYQTAEAVIDKMGGYYTELLNRREHILKTIHAEEERFERTLDQGLERLNEALAQTESKELNGEAAFKLYDTYGMPLEITRDVAKLRGYSVDEAGFAAAREASRERNRASGKFTADFDKQQSYADVLNELKADGFVGENGTTNAPYGDLRLNTKVVAILYDGQPVDHAESGQAVEVVLPETPFYLESGGQVTDTGMICAATNAQTGEEPAWCLRVTDARRIIPGLITHVCEVVYGQPRTGDACVAQVDEARRNAIRRNHTATHILQKSLRETLGSHVGQQGSLVAPDRLRFDFSHSAALTPDEIAQVTDAMNDAILANYPVSIAQRAYKEALAAGAMAFFSEKYGDVVRVVSIGDEDQPAFSMELCGGTHVDATGDIGQALVVSESAVASGVRRIEVVTGRGALELARGQQKQLVEISRTLNTSPDKAAEQTKHVMAQLSETQKALDKAQKELIRYRFNDTLAKTETLNGVPVLIARVEVDGADRLREMSDWFREKHQSGVVVLGAVSADKPALLVGVSQDLNKRGIEAGKLIKEIAAIVGGSGGGRPTLAQAGGKDPARLDEALEKARTTLEKTING